jgi:hypothetical protein
MNHYFFSYSRGDTAFVLRLAEDLRAAGITVWIDQLDIRPSERWDRALEAALRGCAGVLLVLSPRSVASENVMDEVGFALDQQKDVLPVLFEKCNVPLRISRIQYIDFTGDYSQALERCKAALTGRSLQMTPSPREESQPARPAPDARAWQPEILQRAERDMTLYVGPIAKNLVAAAAAQARDESGLYTWLAERIGNADDRAEFLKRGKVAGSATSTPPAVAPDLFDPAKLDAVATELVVYLGPIARHLVKQAAREATDSESLYQRLADRIPDAAQRSTLLKRLRQL